MTRISDKPLAFQALQQRRREREEARSKAVSREVRGTYHAQNHVFRSPQFDRPSPVGWTDWPSRIY